MNKGDVFVWDSELLVKSEAMMLIHCRKRKRIDRRAFEWFICCLFSDIDSGKQPFRGLWGGRHLLLAFCTLTRDIISGMRVTQSGSENVLSAYFAGGVIISCTWHFFSPLLFLELAIALTFNSSSSLFCSFCSFPLPDNETFSYTSRVTPVFFPSTAREGTVLQAPAVDNICTWK